MKIENLKSRKTLAKSLGINYSELELLVSCLQKTPDRFYVARPKLKKDGTIREIYDPVYRLKQVQRSIKNIIVDPLITSDISYGGVRGGKITDCLEPHTNKECIGTLDIESFFPSVKNQMVYACFLKHGYSPTVSNWLTILTTYKYSLPQGTPTSTALANLYLDDFDKELASFCIETNTTVTRWVDDIIFSGSISEVWMAILRAKSLLKIYKLRINKKKTTVRKRNRKQQALGHTVNDKVSVGRNYKQKVRSLTKIMNKYGATSQELHKLAGMISHVNISNPKTGKNFKVAYSQIREKSNN